METSDSTDKLRQIGQQRHDAKMQASLRYSTQSRDRLRRNIETKIRTTMIGSLSVIEQKFGFEWGQGKPRGQLTDHELAMEQLKDELRTEILNLGNNQMRAAIAEIAQYDVRWNRYHYEVSDPEGKETI